MKKKCRRFQKLKKNEMDNFFPYMKWEPPRGGSILYLLLLSIPSCNLSIFINNYKFFLRSEMFVNLSRRDNVIECLVKSDHSETKFKEFHKTDFSNSPKKSHNRENPFFHTNSYLILTKHRR